MKNHSPQSPAKKGLEQTPPPPKQISARPISKARQIQQSQEQALVNLPANTLYIGLWVRDDPPPVNDFHWAFYHHHGGHGGKMYQVKGLGEGWITDHGQTGCIFKSLFLGCLMRIASIDEGRTGELDRVIENLDSELNEIPGVTCRVWLFEVLPRLVEAGFFTCRDPQALQTECLELGDGIRIEASRNLQPRPVFTVTSAS